MISAAIACVGALLSAMAQSAIVFSFHRRGYRPPWWLRLALAAAAVITFVISAGYLWVWLGLPEGDVIRLVLLRPSVTALLVVLPAISLYTHHALRVQEEFMDNVAHELRTSLAIIGGFAEQLTFWPNGISDEAMIEYLNSIRKQAGTMNELIRTILHFERARRNPETIIMRPVDLTFLVHEVVTAVAAAIARPAGVALTVDHLDAVTVNGDPVDLELILNNLLINAVKFSPPAKSGGTVAVSLTQLGQTAVLEVRDTGIGISRQFRPYLFQPFRQEFGDVRRPFRGVGLGLAYVKKIVQVHHGRIEVESEPGKGSLFRVILPIDANGK